MKQRSAYCLLVVFCLAAAIRLSAQEIIRLEGKYMLLNHHNEVITPGFDSISVFNEYSERHYAFLSQGKWAIVKKIDLPGMDWKTLPLKYDFIKPIRSYNSNIGYVVGIDGKTGALNRLLKETVPVRYDDIFTLPNNSSLTAIRNGDKLALIEPSESAVFTDQSFRFVYDDLIDTDIFGILSFRAGTKYGFTYYRDGDHRMTEAVYDTLISLQNGFLKTKQDGKTVYFYSDRYFHESDTAFFRLEVGDGSAFVHLGTFSRMTVDGPVRREKCYFNYPNLLVGIGHTDEILTYDLERQKELHTFPANGTLYSFEVLAMPTTYYAHRYELACFVKSRVHSPDSETGVTEAYTELDGMNKVVEEDLPFEYTLVLEKYPLNGDYLCVRQQDQYGELNRYKRYFVWNSERVTFTAAKPERDWYHRRSSSWGGGGGSADGWMGIFWMGGR